MNHVSKFIGSGAAMVALAVGGVGIADAASSTTKSKSATSTAKSKKSAKARRTAPAGRHIGANGQQEQPLSAGVADKVSAAALAKVGSGATVERTETDVDHGSPYEAHVVKADGTELEVLVNESFEVTAVNTMGGHGPGGPGAPDSTQSNG
ncbi:MAG: hypothetical protein QOJ29_5288 [Thermoleophilaceae bacterium]|nr:hypothetical protein [Thermoleophilaceae bacterium]